MEKIKIALFVGGVSPEAEVSKETGFALYNAIKDLGYEIMLVDPAYGNNQPDNVDDYFKSESYTKKSSAEILNFINSGKIDDVNLVVLGLHGDWGEDGRIQSALEFKNIKYTGSGVLASALAMDKARTKSMLRFNGLSTANWLVAEKNNYDLEALKIKVLDELGEAFVVKPNCSGSSVGLSICKSINELNKALEECFNVSEEAIIEKYVKGRELTVGILGEKILPVLEIKPKNEYYDYEAKYTDGMSEYEVPAKIDTEVAIKIQQDALKAFQVLGCKVYSRVDFLLDENNNYYCLEVNTLPGMTSHSLVPKAAGAIGISFKELVDEIIKLSLLK